MFGTSSDIFYYAVILAVLGLLIGRTLAKQHLITFASFLRERFARRNEIPILVFKKCPQCAEQLPVSALVCDGCDHNFLAGSILRHKLLPAPESSMRGGPTRQSFA